MPDRPPAETSFSRATPRIGLWLNTSDQTAEEAAGAVWRRATEAEVGG
ncbi:MAG: hypothetical protein M3406_06780 [Chloroflexota bacterium]|nr:hypothetical protein [Chloroflexota bacterium]